MVITKGTKVKVGYTGTLDDGTVFDSSDKHGQPLEFTVGEGQLLKGFEDAVIGMKKGEEKEITLKPEEAYGSKNPQLVKAIPRDQFPKDPEPKEGMMIGVELPTGQQMPARIVSVNEKEITLDLNHPLAGQTLHFKIAIEEIED